MRKKSGGGPRKATPPGSASTELNATEKKVSTKRRGRQRKKTFRDFAPVYLAYSEAYNAAKTMDGKRRYVKRLAGFFGARALTNIARAEVEGYILKRAGETSNVVINRELKTLKHFFNYAIARGHVEKNPVKGVRFLKEARRPVDVPSVADVRAILKYCARRNKTTGRPNDALLYDLITVAANTGLRRGDLVSLRADNIDLDRRMIKLRVSKTGGVLYIPLNDAAYEVIKRRANGGLIFKAEVYDTGERVRGRKGYFVTGALASPAPSNTVDRRLGDFRKRFRKAKARAGVEFGFHSLRHFFATYILDAGANIRTVQKLLGHSRVTTTERYLTVSDAQRREAVNTIKVNEGTAAP